MTTAVLMSPPRDQLIEVLQVEGQVWRAKGVRCLAPADAREENARLKKLPAEAILDNVVLKDLAAKMVTRGVKRDAVAHAREHHGLSERRTCSLVAVSRSVIRYRPPRPDDGTLRRRLRESAGSVAASVTRRLGYRLAPDGMTPNHKKLIRKPREENLRVRHRGDLEAEGSTTGSTCGDICGQR